MPAESDQPYNLDAACHWTPVRWRSADGLTLAARDWRPLQPCPDALPVLCLSGLSRNARDFDAVAARLCAQGRRVVAMDYRGRGDSERDPDWRNYSLPVEGQDIDAGIATLGLDRFAILGTSRGGLHAMAMAARHSPSRIAGIVLNDIGPHIEFEAIQRLATTIGKDMTAPDWSAMADRLRGKLAAQFTALSAADWERLARQMCRQSGPAVAFDYDPALGKTLEGLDEGAPTPDLWPLFEALIPIPLLVLRGETSDMFGVQTLAEMAVRHPNCETLVVPGEGHAPLLWDAATQEHIAAFLARVDTSPSC
ncbi:alpha/beta fold hydrolase [Polymorphum gilvum]|nr:alpha/beta hydrolase [Polymorphum gilvum]